MSRLTASPELSHPVHLLLDNTPSNKPEPIPVFKGTDATFLEQGKEKRIAFVLQDLLTAEECSSLIAATEGLGDEQALLNIGYGRQILDESVQALHRGLCSTCQQNMGTDQVIRSSNCSVWK
ncbi:hypothetical protein BCR33DRAFT_714828 [Rhizoclosmatium globosum]|uniref:Uncharacterized protein n=1 Tax=Rhizoclosmatium globosum TaxID=329046 RepID=A0A1Y2CL99_9FUNG|nr:hypothetical protein BCR33DRAFT_714828 [Rhizoclosmatium globosum]|eukprot:ORY47763.1 hypothetical protein BCR33DRAFT_714828 [Rhizoclosmatium globosum]